MARLEKVWAEKYHLEKGSSDPKCSDDIHIVIGCFRSIHLGQSPGEVRVCCVNGPVIRTFVNFRTSLNAVQYGRQRRFGGQWPPKDVIRCYERLLRVDLNPVTRTAALTQGHTYTATRNASLNKEVWRVYGWHFARHYQVKGT